MHLRANSGWICRACHKKSLKPLVLPTRRKFTSTRPIQQPEFGFGAGDDARALLERTRNIGIIAHIDAVRRAIPVNIVYLFKDRGKLQLLSACSIIVVTHAGLEVLYSSNIHF